MIFDNDLKRKLSFCVASVILSLEVLLLGNAIIANAQDVVPYDKFGDISHYNGVVFDEFISYQADMEGALAVGGYGQFGIKQGSGYDIGAAGPSHYSPTVQVGKYENPNGYPTLLYNGEDMRIGANSSDTNAFYQVLDGPLVMSSSMKNKFDSFSLKLTTSGQNSGVKTADKEELNRWFETQYSKSVNASNRYESANDTYITFGELALGTYRSNLSRFENKNLWKNSNGEADDRILVINVNSDATVILKDEWNSALQGNPRVYYSQEFLNYDLVIINFVDAVDVSFSGGQIWLNEGNALPPNDMSISGAYAGRVLWNFPKAQTIRMQSFTMHGSILAPNAYLHGSGGSINGQLICHSFTTENALELHAITIPPRVFEDDEEDDLVGSIEVRKLEEGSIGAEVVLQGAVFRLEKKQEDSGEFEAFGEATYETDINGSIVITDLPLGVYRMTEIQAPKGYELSLDNAYEFTIDEANGVADILHYLVYNKEEMIDVSLRKVDEADLIEGLSGARFVLYRMIEKTSTKTLVNSSVAAGNAEAMTIVGYYSSDTEGLITLTGLSQGTYQLAEIQSPEGYTIIGDGFINFTIGFDDDGILTVLAMTDSTGAALETSADIPLIKNRKEPEIERKIKLIKQDYDSNVTLSEVEFILNHWNGTSWVYMEQYGTLVTDQYGWVILEGLEDGQYQLIEIKASENYLLADDEEDKNELYYYIREFTIENGLIQGAKADEEQVLILYNKKATIDLELEKVSSFDGEAIPKVSFSLYKLNQGKRYLISDQITNAAGKAYFKNLEAGRYELMETDTPAGYQPLEDSIFFEISISEQGIGTMVIGKKVIAGETLIYRLENEPYLGSLEIFKIDSVIEQKGIDENTEIIYQPLDGAVFQLERRIEVDGSNEWVTYGDTFESANGGRAIVKDLPLGVYRIIELSAPDGYELLNQSGIVDTFTISRDSSGTITTVYREIKNYTKEPRGNIQVKKIDGISGEALSGSEFKLWKISHGEEFFHSQVTLAEIMRAFDSLIYFKFYTEKPLISDTEGMIDLGELTPGVYLLFESVAPEGYLYTLGPDQKFGSKEDLSFYNYLTVFKVSAKDSNDIDSGVLIEWLDINKLRTNHASFENFEDYGLVTVTNKKADDIIADVLFYKEDSENQMLLSGAEFNLYQYDEATDKYDKFVMTVNSDSEGRVMLAGLTSGKYRVIETVAPDGYLLNETAYDFELRLNKMTKVLDFYVLQESGAAQFIESGYLEPDDNGTVGIFKSQFQIPEHFQNYPITEDLQLIKTDLTGELLDGAEFILQKKDNAGNWIAIHQKTTNEAGQLILPELSVGSYKLIEETAPLGYQIAAAEYPFTIELTEDGSLKLVGLTKYQTGEFELTFTNQELEIELEIKKVDGADHKPLKGAQFNLLKKVDGEYQWFAVSGLSGADGVLHFTELTIGEYRLEEVQAPEGYQQLGALMEFAVLLDENENVLYLSGLSVNEQNQVVIENQQITGGFTLEKSGKLEDGSQIRLAGVGFELRKVSSNGDFNQMIHIPVTDSDGIIQVDNLKEGRYQLKEIAPLAGYELNTLEIVFDLKLSEDNEHLVMEIVSVIPNELQDLISIDTNAFKIELTNIQTPAITGSIVIRKTNQAGTVLLGGGAFLLEKLSDDNTTVEFGPFTTETGVPLLINGLKAGNYRLREIKSPEGYQEARNQVIEFALVEVDDRLAINFLAGSEFYQDSENQNGILVVNQLLKAGIQIRKLNSENPLELLTGAEFELYPDGETTPIIITDGKIEDLAAGSYYLVESKAPQGYLKDFSLHFVLKSDEQQEYLELWIDGEKVALQDDIYWLDVVNQPLKGDVMIRKEGERFQEWLSGAVFALYQTDEDYQPIGESLSRQESGLDGIVSFTNLSAGKYILEEVKAPEGYRKKAPIRFELKASADQTELILIQFDENGDEVVTEQLLITVTNTKLRKDVRLRKADDTTGELLFGARFHLYKYDEEQGSYSIEMADPIVDGDGYMRFENLERGKYRIVEVKAPEGYQLNPDSLYFTLESNHEQTTLIIDADSAHLIDEELVFYNSKLTGDVKFFKTNGTSGLPGAEFLLYRLPDMENPLGSYYSELNGAIQITGLLAGSYLLKEVKAPAGYILTTDDVIELQFEMKINENNTGLECQIISNTANDKNSEVLINKAPLGTIEITKTGLNKENLAEEIPLSGASFKLYRNPNNELIGEGSTNSAGLLKFENLAVGSYLLKEVIAPDGYQMIGSGQIAFEIKVNDESNALDVIWPADELGTKDGQIKIKNQIIVGEVEIYKYDQTASGEAAENPLSGVWFSLYQVGDEETSLAAKETNSSGYLKFENLLPGDYILKETTFKEGYVVEDIRITFTVIAESDKARIIWHQNSWETDQQQIKIGNRQQQLDVILYKHEDENFSIALKDARFQLYRKLADGTYEADFLMEEVTGMDGKLVFRNLGAGTYGIKEVNAPAGYERIDDYFDIVVRENEDGSALVLEYDGSLVSQLPIGNQSMAGKITLLKVDSNTGKPLSGAAFSLIYDPDVTKTVIAIPSSDADGRIVIENLKVGLYELKEISPPADYQEFSEAIRFKLVPDEDNNQLKLEPITLGDETLVSILTDEGNIIVKNEKSPDPTGSIEIAKVDAVDTTMLLGGARFELLKKVDGVFIAYDEYVTAPEQPLKIGGLTDGEYRLTELVAPDGYQLVNTVVEFSFTLDGSGENKVLNFAFAEGFEDYADLMEGITNGIRIANQKLTGDLQIDKVNKDDHQEKLSGAMFWLYKYVSETDHYEESEIQASSEDAYLFTGLSAGKYQLKELVAPDGYKRGNPIEFELKADAKQEQLQLYLEGTLVTTESQLKLTIENEQLETALLLFKVDSEYQSEGLLNAFFNLYRDGETLPILDSPYQTIGNGKVLIEGLTTGRYYLQEISAPDGYILSSELLWFTVQSNENQDGLVIEWDTAQLTEEQGTTVVTILNQPITGDVEFHKLDQNDSSPIENAMFSLYRKGAEDTPIRENIASDQEGKIYLAGLRAGSYVLIETEAPEYYHLTSPVRIEFTMEWTDADYEALSPIVTENITNGDLKTFIIYNQRVSGEIKLFKYNLENNDGLTDAEFHLYKETDLVNPYRTGTTAHGGRLNFKDIPLGRYFLREVKAPFGYQILNNDIFLELIQDEHGTVLTLWGENSENKQDLMIANTPLKGEIEIEKRDSESGQLLDGVLFTLYPKENTGGSSISGYTVDGRITFSNLALGQYQLIEEETLTGYQLLNEAIDLEIAATEAGGVQVVWKTEGYHYDGKQVVILNDKILPTANVMIYKYDEDNHEPLAGVLFGLFVTSKADAIQEAWTDENGYLSFTDISAGEYQIKELKALDGYGRLRDGIQFRVEYEGEQAIVSWESEGNYDQNLVMIANKRAPLGILEINKYFLENGERYPLSDAEFTLYDEFGNEIINELTDTDGRIVVADLTPGYYKLIEVKAPTGYQTEGRVISFEMISEGETAFIRWFDSDLDTSGNCIRIANKPLPRGSLEVLKIDQATRIPLLGARFELYREVKEKVPSVADGAMLVTNNDEGVTEASEESEPFETTMADETKENLDDESESVIEEAPEEGTKELETELSEAAEEETEVESIEQSNESATDEEYMTADTTEQDIENPSTKEAVTEELETKADELDEINEEAVENDETQANDEMEPDNHSEENVFTQILKRFTALLKTFFLMEIEVKAEVVEIESEIVSEWTKVGNYRTSIDGTFIIEDLEPGSYKLVEIEAPAGYRLNNNEYEWFFEIDEDGEALGTLARHFIIENELEAAETSTATEPEPTEPGPTKPEPTEPEPTESEPTESKTTRPPKEYEETTPTKDTATKPEETTLVEETSENVTESVSTKPVPTTSSGYTFRYDPERDEYLVIDPNGVPLGYVKSPDDFVLNVPKTGDRSPILLLVIIMIGGAAAVVVLTKKEK